MTYYFFFPPHSLFFLLYTIFVVFMITLEIVTWVLMKVRFLKCLYHASLKFKDIETL